MALAADDQYEGAYQDDGNLPQAFSLLTLILAARAISAAEDADATRPG